MAQTKIGGSKVRMTRIKNIMIKHPDLTFEEAEQVYKSQMSAIGSKGGSKTGVIKGFAANKERAVSAGRLGGSISKRRPKGV